MRCRPAVSSLLALFSISVLPAATPPSASVPLTAEQILQKVTFPEEFSATVFAAPPDVSYPVFISAAPDGTLFIGCDQNGSLGREPSRGSIVRARDTNGDGRADEFKVFARMDSPRGVAWDQ